MVETITVIGVGEASLRTSTGCTDPLPSLTLYVDWLKLTIIIGIESSFVEPVSVSELSAGEVGASVGKVLVGEVASK